MPHFLELAAHYEGATTYEEWQRPGEKEVRTELWARRARIIRRFARGRRLLDVGTGDGHFLEHVSDEFSVRATEISNRAASCAKLRGFSPLLGRLEDLDLEAHSFDVITLWHVMEHLPSPSSMLEHLEKLLAPEGVVVIAVPNEVRKSLRVIEREVSSIPGAGDEIHLYFWTPRSLVNMFQSHGWKVSWLGVDDVHLRRNPWTAAKYRVNVLLARLTGWHFDAATVVVVQPRPAETW